MSEVKANIDIVPIFLGAAGITVPTGPAGPSFLPWVQSHSMPWRKDLLYVSPWGWNFPETPAVWTVRTNRYRYEPPNGLRDSDELYDLQTHSHELHNLIYSREHEQVVTNLRQQMFAQLQERGGTYIPSYGDRGLQFISRDPQKEHAADFHAPSTPSRA